MTLACRFEGAFLTVGEKRTLTCDLGHAVALTPQTQFANGDTKSPYDIQFLGSPQAQGNVVSQVFTSYKVGTHVLDKIVIKNLEGAEIQISPLNVEVKTIIQGSPTPFPLYDPEKVDIPLWWWAMWGALILAVGGWVTYKGLQIRKKRKAERDKPVEKILTPEEKFHSRVRKLASKEFHVKGEYKIFAVELTQIVKSTIGEQLAFAAEDLTSEEFLETLERRHKAFNNVAGVTLSRFLEDLDQIKFAKVETGADKCSELLDKAASIGNALFRRIG